MCNDQAAIAIGTTSFVAKLHDNYRRAEAAMSDAKEIEKLLDKIERLEAENEKLRAELERAGKPDEAEEQFGEE